MGQKWANSEHHCVQVDELDSEGHELPLTAFEWPRRASWTSVGRFSRSKPPEEKSLTETRSMQPGRKVNCQVEKVGSRCGQVGVEVVECQAWAPARLDSRCWGAWTSVRRILSWTLLPEEIELQISKAAAKDFGNRENTKFEIHCDQLDTAATHDHHRCHSSSDSREQLPWPCVGRILSLAFREKISWVECVILLLNFKVLMEFSKSSKWPKKMARRWAMNKMANRDGFGWPPWAETSWRIASDVQSTSSNSLRSHRPRLKTVRHDFQDDGRISIKKGVSKWRRKSEISPASTTSLS